MTDVDTPPSPTPGPWKVSANAARASEWLVLTDDDLVATCDGASPEANAQLIVTAVNAHDGLVRALRDFVRWVEVRGDTVYLDELAAKARAAIAKGEGRAAISRVEGTPE